MSRARERADRGGTSPIRIGTTILNKDSAGDLTVKDSAQVLKKVIAAEVQVGTGADKIVIKRDSDTGKVAFKTADSTGVEAITDFGSVLSVDSASLLPVSGNAKGDLKFVTNSKALYLWDSSAWVNSNAVTRFYFVVAGSVAASTGTVQFVPDRTITLQSITAKIDSAVGAALIFTIKKNGSALQQFTLPAGDTSVSANFSTGAAYSITTSNNLTLDVDSGTATNLSVRVNYY